MIIVDAHLDLAFNALRHGRDLLQPLGELRDFEEKTDAESRKVNGTAIVTLPALREAGVKSFLVPFSCLPSQERLQNPRVDSFTERRRRLLGWPWSRWTIITGLPTTYPISD